MSILHDALKKAVKEGVNIGASQTNFKTKTASHQKAKFLLYFVLIFAVIGAALYGFYAFSTNVKVKRNYLLSGIVYEKKEPFAIINDVLLREGDVIEDIMVYKVATEFVEVKTTDGSNRIIKLRLQSRDLE